MRSVEKRDSKFELPKSLVLITKDAKKKRITRYERRLIMMDDYISFSVTF